MKITDIRELAPAWQEVWLEIQKLMKDLVLLGLAGAICLNAPDGDITAQPFNARLSRPSQPDAPSATRRPGL